VRTKLQEIDTSLPTAREVREVRLQQTGMVAANDPTRSQHRISIIRAGGGAVKTMVVAEETLLEPGDIVEVRRLRPPSSLTGPGAAATQAPAPRAASPPASKAAALQRPERAPTARGK
jgi:polysaccharide export outer membrane protein